VRADVKATAPDCEKLHLGFRSVESLYESATRYILPPVSKHLIDLDEAALSAARAELGTVTIKDTVNEALRRATDERPERVLAALDLLARAELDDRQRAWR